MSFCTENSDYRYAFFFSCPADNSENQANLLIGLLLSLDMAL